MTNKPEQLYDPKELRTIASGNDLFFNEMIKLFISQIEAALQEIENLAVNSDYEKIKKVLHKIKPSVMVMGVTTATEIIEQFEQLDLSTTDASVFSDLLLKIENILRVVNDQLRLI